MSFLDKFKRTNKKQIKVSVIIPVYNTEQYLDKCLNSIEQQTLTDIEIICIDDCSTDSSLDILKDHARKDNRIIILQNEENKGAGYSRNIGLNIAQGKYIMFIDSDDYIDLETLEYCFKKSEEEEVEVLMFKARNWDIEEKKYVKNDMIELCPLEDYNNKIFNHDDIDSDLLFKISVTAQTKLFLRSYLEENEFRFPEDIIHEDNPFFIKMFLTAKRVYVMDKYFYHRILRSGSIITLKGLVILDIIDSLEITLRFLMNNSEFYNKYHESYYEYMMHTINNRLKIIKPEYLNNFFNYCKSFIQKCIVEYDLDSDIRKSLSKHFLHFYNLMVLSIKSDNEKVQNIQQELTLDMPVSIIIYCDNKTPTQINEIVHNLTYQDKIFAYMNLIFVSDTSISDETNQVIKEYEETLYNVNRIQLDSIDKLNNYKQIMDSITSQYVLFYDENMTYEDTFIKDIFRKSRVAQKNIEQDLEYEQKHDIKQLTSGSKLLKRKFLSKSDNVFIEENTSIINPFMFYKGNKPKHEKIMEILSEFIEEQTAIQKYNNIILDTLRISFYDTEVSVKNEYFTQIKKFIHQKIIKNDLNTLFREKMSKTNEMFYDLIILSLNSNTENIHKLQEKIRFNSPISIIIFCDNKTSAQINNIVHNLINQSMNFSYMNLVFITNTSISNETKKLVKEYKQTFYNMNTIELESIDKINSYRQILNNITSQYILFYDEKVTYDYSFIKNIFRKTRVAQKSIEQDLEYEQKYEIKPLTIGTKLLKRKFLLKKDNVFIETSTPLINPYMFYKGNQPKQDKVIE
ncbi:glycosyltransferase family 2 protein, partial [Methanosphaera sp.]